MFLFKLAINFSREHHPDQFQPGENDWKDILVGIKTICESDPNCTIHEDYVSRPVPKAPYLEYPKNKYEVPYLKVSVKRGLVEYMQVFSLYTYDVVSQIGRTFTLIGLKQIISIWKYNGSISPHYVEDEGEIMKFQTAKTLSAASVTFSIYDGHTFLWSDYYDYDTENQIIQITRFTSVYSIQSIYPEDTNPNIGLFKYDSSKEFAYYQGEGFAHMSCIKPNVLDFQYDTRETLICGAYDMFGRALNTPSNRFVYYMVNSNRRRSVLGSIIYRRLGAWQPDQYAIVGNIRNILITPHIYDDVSMFWNFMDVGGVLYFPTYIPPRNSDEPGFYLCVCVGSNRL